MRRTCQWQLSICEQCPILCENPEHYRERMCGKAAVAHIDWGSGSVYWYCAEHYDLRIQFVRECGRTDVLKASGVL